MNLPRSINRESSLQAANPAVEMARLTSMLGLGSQSFAALSAVLISIAALSIFTGLAGSLENRMGDLAVLRAIGYSKCRVFKIILCEGMMIVVCGLILGFVMGFGGFVVLTEIIGPLKMGGASFDLSFDVLFIISAVFFAGIVASLLPAWRASHIDIGKQLSTWA